MPETHPWYAMPRWKKRLHGFACYQLAAFVSLISPERADGAMHKVLSDQFAGGKPARTP